MTSEKMSTGELRLVTDGESEREPVDYKAELARSQELLQELKHRMVDKIDNREKLFAFIKRTFKELDSLWPFELNENQIIGFFSGLGVEYPADVDDDVKRGMAEAALFCDAYLADMYLRSHPPELQANNKALASKHGANLEKNLALQINEMENYLTHLQNYTSRVAGAEVA
jgi:hypothetical protein